MEVSAVKGKGWLFTTTFIVEMLLYNPLCVDRPAQFQKKHAKFDAGIYLFARPHVSICMTSTAAAVFHNIMEFLQRNVDGNSSDSNDSKLICLLLVGSLEEQRWK